MFAPRGSLIPKINDFPILDIEVGICHTAHPTADASRRESKYKVSLPMIKGTLTVMITDPSV